MLYFHDNRPVSDFVFICLFLFLLQTVNPVSAVDPAVLVNNQFKKRVPLILLPAIDNSKMESPIRLK